MKKVLLPVDGSAAAVEAALYLVHFVEEHGAVEIHVLNVQACPLEWQSREMEQEAIDSHRAVEAHLAMNPVLHALNKKGIVHQTHVKLGDAAETAVALAAELGCDHIVMGTRGLHCVTIAAVIGE